MIYVCRIEKKQECTAFQYTPALVLNGHTTEEFHCGVGALPRHFPKEYKKKEYTGLQNKW